MKRRLLVSLAVLATAYMLLMLDGSALETLALTPTSEGLGDSASFSPVLGMASLERSNLSTATWSPPARIISATVDCANPALALDRATGALHLVWEEAAAAGNRIAYARLEASAAWQIEPLPAPQGDSPAIALDARGLLHIAYVQVVSEQMQIYYRARTLDGWSPPSRVSQAVGQCAHPDIAIALDGALELLWVASAGASRQLYHARSTDHGATWGLIEPIFYDASYAQGNAPSLAVAPDGGLWVAYQGILSPTDTGTVDVYVLRQGEGAWLPPVNVSRGQAGSFARGAEIACDPQGQVHLVWETESPDGAFAIHYALHSAGSWSTPLRLSPPDETAMRPALAVSSDGTVYVAWVSGNTLSFRKRTTNGMWGPLERIATDQVGLRDVTLVAERDMVYAVWNARGPSGLLELFFSQRSPAPTQTPTARPTNTSTTTPTTTPTATSTSIPTPTWTPTTTPEETLLPPTSMPMLTQTATPTETATPTPTLSQTPLPSPTPTRTATFVPRAFVPAVFKVSNETSPERNRETSNDSPSPPAKLQALPAWAWSQNIENVSSSSGDSRRAALAVAPNGTVYAVWQEWDEQRRRWMLYYRLRVGGSWSTPVPFFAGEQPDLGIGPDGQVHLVYANEMFGNYEIFYTTWLGHQWAASKNVSNTKEGISSQPAIAFDAAGSPVIVWTDTTGGQEYIYFAYPTNGAWQTYWVASSYGGSAPDLALGKNGRLWLTWQAKEGDQYDIFALFGDGRSWHREAVNVSDSMSADSVAPRLAAHPSWGAFLVWQEDGSNASGIYYADTLEGIDWWSEPVSISQLPGQPAQPSIAINAAGDVHVAWEHRRASTQGSQLLHRRRDPMTRQWLPCSEIVNEPSNSGLGEVKLTIGLGREIHALWSKPLANAKRDVYYRKGDLAWSYFLRLPLLFTP